MAAQSDHLAFLRSTPLFASVPDDTLARVAEIACEKPHSEGNVIVSGPSGRPRRGELYLSGTSILSEAGVLFVAGHSGHVSYSSPPIDGRSETSTSAVTASSTGASPPC